MDYYYPDKTSKAIMIGGISIYTAGLILIASFASPYWLTSYDETHAVFEKMGLWQYCFDNFRYPSPQVENIFSGCHSIFSQDFDPLREKLLPGWMIMVQVLISVALFLSYFVQSILVMIIVRYPVKFVLKNEWGLSTIAAVCSTITAFFLLLAITIFGSQCHRRDWLQNPKYNYLSWSYWFVLISLLMHAIGGFSICFDARANYWRRKTTHTLVPT